MSSDIYIDLKHVANRIELFEFNSVLNGDVETFVEMLEGDENDYHSAIEALKPVLMCKFGARETWRYVELFDEDLHVSCAGDFRFWFINWLADHQISYTII